MSARGLVVSVVGMVFGLLVFASAPSLAAAPEAPEVTVGSPVSATKAVLHGVLNPSAAGPVEAGSYQFLYKQGKAGCEGGSKAPEPAGLALGRAHEEVSEEVSGLTPGTEYSVCLSAENGKGEATVGSAVTFTTAIPPEMPETQAASAVTVNTARLNGVLNPKAPGDPGFYEFRYRQSVSQCKAGLRESQLGAPASPGTALGHEKEAVSAEATGLLPGTTYTFCLFAVNNAGESALGVPVTFTTPALPPAIEAQSTSNVEASEARLEAVINPGGSPTVYHFEYGPAAGSYETSIPTPAPTIAAGATGVKVNTVATGLKPGTTYHYRVVAANGLPAEVDGPDQTFTTAASQGTGSQPNCPNEQARAEQPYALGLPDCRAYEMVSPLEKGDNDATSTFVINPAGSRASVSGDAITYSSDGAFAGPVGAPASSQYVSSRGAGGWSTRSITPASSSSVLAPLGNPYEDLLFTPDLSKGVLRADVALTSEAAGEFYENLYTEDFATNSYDTVSTEERVTKPSGDELLAIGASVDLSHVVFEAPGNERYNNLFEWTNGQLRLINVAPNGEPTGAGVGSGHRPGFIENTWRAVSQDGLRVFMTSGGQLYVRENPEQPQSPVDGLGKCTVPSDACTVEVSASQRTVTDPNGPRLALYSGASVDGSRVFFTSSAELTDNAQTGPADNAANLYEYDLENGRLTDLTVDTKAGDTNGAGVLGVTYISEDGSYVYFVAEGKLAAGGVAGQPNLYLDRAGTITYIATLGGSDGSVWARPTENSIRATGDGKHLAFVSSMNLTGYDNTDAITGKPDTEVFAYDAQSGVLACASCNPSGVRPVGSSNLDSIELAHGRPYVQRNFSEDGSRLFFQSMDALTAHDSNGLQDVYEYENGHIYPISDVAGGHESFFLDASPNGDDVFFGTAVQLLPQDTDIRIDVYDARVGGGFPVSVAPPACANGDSCKGPVSPQPGVFGAPASATFVGAGNVVTTASAKPVVKAKQKAKPKKKKRKKRKGRKARRSRVGAGLGARKGAGR